MNSDAYIWIKNIQSIATISFHILTVSVLFTNQNGMFSHSSSKADTKSARAIRSILFID